MSNGPLDTGNLTATALGGLIGGGVIDPVTVIGQTFAAIEACPDPAIFTRLHRDRAEREALASAARHAAGTARGLLDGVPVAWKDLFDLQGVTTTAGSTVLAGNAPAAADAAVVARLRDAGMITVGHVNMTEFAYSGLGLNPHYGTPSNPHGGLGEFAPGGSSAGSGVAVARHLVPVSIGSDTGGSVRIPAAFNGIVGYKSSAGRYPMGGIFPLSTTLDTVGILCRSVTDAILVDAPLRGTPLPVQSRAVVAGMRIVIPANVVFEGCEPAVIENFEASIQRLQAAGAVVERRAFPAFDEIISLHQMYGPLAAAEAYALHRERITGPEAERMDRRVAARIRAASSISMVDYVRMRQARDRLVAAMAAELGGDFVAYPTVAITAPSIAALEADDAYFTRLNSRVLLNTLLGNVLDWCGVSLPNGVDARGLPTGFLLQGGPGRDDSLLAAALACEAVVQP